MKSLHLVHCIYPEGSGGTEIHTSLLCEKLSGLGEEVILLTNSRELPGTKNSY